MVRITEVDPPTDLKILIDSTCGLSRFCTGQIIHFDDKLLTSIESGAWYLAMRVANDLDGMATVEKLKYKPQLIRSALKERVKNLPDVLLKFDHFYRLSLKEALCNPGSAALRKFKSLAESHGPWSDVLQFLVSSGTKEYTWSTGMRPSQLRQLEGPYKCENGLNIYGKIVGETFETFCDSNYPMLSLDLNSYVENFFFSDAVKTVLILSDSFSKYVKSVDGGTVKKWGGATYSDLMRDHSIRMGDYSVVIFVCGHNCAFADKSVWKAEFEPLLRMINNLLNNYAHLHILLSSAIPSVTRTSAGRIDQYNDFIEAQLSNLPIDRFYFLNHSFKGGEPFVENGELVRRYFNFKPSIHLNHIGTTQLFKSFGLRFPELQQLSIVLSKKAYVDID